MLSRISAFEEKVNDARFLFYNAGSKGLFARRIISNAVVDALVARNEVVRSGVRAGPDTTYKITPKGIVEHRRHAGVDDSL